MAKLFGVESVKLHKRRKAWRTGDKLGIQRLIQADDDCSLQLQIDFSPYSAAAMAHSELTQHIRQLVAEAFARANMPQPDQFSESILIKAGNYCGRRFVGNGGHAVWFVEEHQLKLYGANGKLLQVISTLTPSAQPLRRAA